nr:MAG TPA: A-kinase anchoring protein 95 [Caudoviricetes sp.]DAQ65554.1 MAG TPA: A-kinase anchoring protein 95 [Caudoviricetes sp.]
MLHDCSACDIYLPFFSLECKIWKKAREGAITKSLVPQRFQEK